MARIDRRDMLKVMAATAAGAAGAIVSSTGVDSVLAASPAPPGPSGIAGTGRTSIRATGPRVAFPAASPYTFYQTVSGSYFEPGEQSETWSTSGPFRFVTNGGYSLAPLHIPQGALITECIFVVQTPSTATGCNLISMDPVAGTLAILGNATTTVAAGTQLVTLTVTPTTVDNSTTWYMLDYEGGSTTDTVIQGARVGWMHHPGLTLFPNPRRIVSGDLTPFVNGTTYGPFDATMTTGGAPTGVPPGAKAAFCAVQSYSPGVLTIFPDATADPGIANYSGTGSLGSGLNMVYMMVPLSPAGKFKIHSYITGRAYVDAWGYVV